MWPVVNHREAKRKAEYKQTLLFVNTYLNSEQSISTLAPPEPDFLFEFEGKSVGIEHTLLSYNDQGGLENRNLLSSIARDISLAAESAAIGILPEKGLSILLSFDYSALNTWLEQGNQIKKKDKQAIANAIVELAKDAIPGTNQACLIERNYLQPEICRMPFPIKSIVVYQSHLSFDTHIGGAGGHTVLGLNPALISNTIARKEPKIKNYKNAYDELWLLMIVNKFSYETDIHFHDKEEVMSIDFYSSFTRAFVFEQSSKEIIELKTVK